MWKHLWDVHGVVKERDKVGTRPGTMAAQEFKANFNSNKPRPMTESWEPELSGNQWINRVLRVTSSQPLDTHHCSIQVGVSRCNRRTLFSSTISGQA